MIFGDHGGAGLHKNRKVPAKDLVKFVGSAARSSCCGRGIRLVQVEQVQARSYLDALSDYEKVNKEAIALARRKQTTPRTDQHVPRDLYFDALPEPDAVRDVMLRWHHSLMRVLEAGDRVLQHTLELTTEA